VNVQDDSEDLTVELLPELSEFNTGVDINKFLARILKLVTEGAISPRLGPRLHRQPAPPPAAPLAATTSGRPGNEASCLTPATCPIPKRNRRHDHTLFFSR